MAGVKPGFVRWALNTWGIDPRYVLSSSFNMRLICFLFAHVFTPLCASTPLLQHKALIPGSHPRVCVFLRRGAGGGVLVCAYVFNDVNDNAAHPPHISLRFVLSLGIVLLVVAHAAVLRSLAKPVQTNHLRLSPRPASCTGR